MDPLRTERPESPPPDDGGQAEDLDSRISRRRLIQTMGVAGGAALAGVSSMIAPDVAAALQDATPEASEAAGGIPPEVPPWMKEWGPLPSEYGSRSSFEDGVVRAPSATSSRSPLGDLHGIITPNSLFFERHHAGVPQIDPSVHRLMIHGMVDRPTIFTVDDIKRFPSKSVIHFLECSGNSGSAWREESLQDTAQLAARPGQRHGVDRRADADAVERSRHPARRHLAALRRRRCSGDDAQRTHREGDGGWAARLRPERRGATARAGISRCGRSGPDTKATRTSSGSGGSKWAMSLGKPARKRRNIPTCWQTEPPGSSRS